MIDEKKKYKDPELEIISFSNEDIITLSLGDDMTEDENKEDF